jgi:hypothetical protein
MRIGERRLLSAGEQSIARDLFANEIEPERIEIAQAPPLLGFGAMAPFRRTIFFARFRAPRDFAAAHLRWQALFAHELTHCWQAARGVLLPVAKLSAIGARAYRYRLAPGKPFRDYNIEQQAEIVRHLFLARCGEPETGAPPRLELEALWARR